MKVLFAPDWREGVPYQRLLAEALRAEGVKVEFLRDYKRGLPLARLLRATAAAQSCEVLHLHWPEAYYPIKHDGWDGLRLARYPLDLALARRGRALVVTAHNLHAHNRGGARFEERNTRASFHQARIVIAHSPAAQAEIVQRFGVAPERIRVIPHGDLSRGMGAPLPRGEARRALGLGGERLVLMFGALEPYKGIEEAMAFWRRQQPEATLIVAGRPQTPAYEAHLIEQARGIARVDFRPGWLSDDALHQWLSAADAVLFNYRAIFTSGAACLARSYGVPIVLPERLRTVWLDEPTPLVHRFSDLEASLAEQLTRALATVPDFAAARPWREATAWPRVAAATACVYRDACAMA